tara:strand:+ start:2788 stop:3051 length:264 start_codon:yes stop_codon:yes gene_type:complete
LLASLAIFPISIQPIFIAYFISIAGAIYLSNKPKSNIVALYLAFVSRWLIFILFTILSIKYVAENTLIAVFLLVYLNITFNPKQITE